MNAPFSPTLLSATDIDLDPFLAKSLAAADALAPSPPEACECEGLTDKNRKIHAILRGKRLPMLLDFFSFSLSKIDPDYEVTKFEADSILRLALAAELKDLTTGTHIVRMSLYSAFLARELGFNRNDCRNIMFAALAHDVGKIGIPDEILLKPDRLTSLEFEMMKQHSIIGSIMLEESAMLHGSNAALMAMARDIALFHHENYDGTGYPIQGSGEAIPLPARIVRICDTFDAITSDRPYKKRLSTDAALAIIQNDSGKAFDPRIVECLSQSFGRLSLIQTEIETFGS